MIALHGAWADGGLILWGEDPHGPPHARPRRGRPPKSPRPRPHPFACDASLLKEVAGDGTAAPVVLLLPSAKTGPQASPELLRDSEDGSGARVGVAAWTAPALHLEPGAALDLLLRDPPRDVRVGASLLHLTEVARLGLELAARGEVFPWLEPGDLHARWRPAPPTGEDGARLAMLIKYLPPAARAANGAGLRPANEVVNDALRALTDAAVRDALHGFRAPVPPRSHDPHHVWLRALAAADPAVDTADGFAPALEEWVAPLTHTAPFRMCLRLVEPPGDEGSWSVEILLQASDDPSLLVPAETVWTTLGPLTLPGRTIADPQGYLLKDLARAAPSWPQLERALDEAAPARLDVSLDDVADLLERADALEKAGFGLIVPSWFYAPASRLRARLKVSQPREASVGGKLGLDQLCRYEWSVSLGDDSLTLKDLQALAKLKLPVVQMKGRWIRVDPARIRSAIELLERPTGEMPLGEMLATAASPDRLAMDAVELDVTGRLERLLGASDEMPEVTETPDGFHGALRPYQRRGVAWLRFLGGLGLGACLADDMGLGKTAQLLALCLADRGGKGPRPTIVICPVSVAGNWMREAGRFTPSLKVLLHHGPERLTGKRFAAAARRADLVVTTYSMVVRDHHLLESIKWRRVVLDEAQAVKNSSTKQARAVRRLPALHRIALTGTPVENRLSELHSLMDFLNPGVLGSARSFRRTFATPIERFRDEDAARRLRRLTQPFVLRRLKTDRKIIADLPDKLEIKVPCTLTREQASLYQATVDDMIMKIESSEGIERKGLVLATIAKLKQICNHPGQLLRDDAPLAGRSGKLQRLEEILEEILAEGDKALCFTQFAEFGHRLRAHLQERFGLEVLYLHGGTRRAARDDMVARFQSADGPWMFLISLKAGGTGLNLTAASQVIHFDRWWNPAVEDQATDRAYRIGQKRNVQVRKFICSGTLEERIDELIEHKKDLADRIVGGGEAWLTELSTQELRSVIELSARPEEIV